MAWARVTSNIASTWFSLKRVLGTQEAAGRAIRACQFGEVQRSTKLRRRKPIVRAMDIVMGEKVRRVKEKGWGKSRL
jgi:hypothetical protein